MSAAHPKEFRPSSASPAATPRDVDPTKPIENAEQLRVAIDRGHGGDKVDAVDPAAAPLGTDDEAGGAPPTRQQVRAAAAAEVHNRPSQPQQKTSGLGHAWWLVALWAVLAIATASIYFIV